jgi:predicted peroxiredoxin
VLLRSGGHEAAHYALVVATGAAAVGRPVVLFATNAGCRLLLRDAPLLADAREALLEARGVAGIATLWEAAEELGIRRIACEAGLRAEAIVPADLAGGVEVAGIVTFLAEVGAGQMLAL